MSRLPLLSISLAFFAGVLLADWLSAPLWIWVLLLGVGILASIPTIRQWFEKIFPHGQGLKEHWQRFSPLSAGILLTALFLGGTRYQLSLPCLDQGNLAWYRDRGAVHLTGRVVRFPEQVKNTTLLYVKAQTVSLDGAEETRRVKGLAVVMLPSGDDWRYGDVVALKGKLTVPDGSGEVSLQQHDMRQGVYSQMFFPRARLVARGKGFLPLSAIYWLRQKAYRAIRQALPMPESALLAGILLGIDDDLPETLVNAFRDTGTAHIYAISGFNIALIAALFSLFTARLVTNRWLALAIASGGVLFYALLVGAQPSVVRAAIMGVIGLLGHHLGRQQHGITALAFSAALMCMVHPHVLWGVSFQLSFAATAGLILYASRMQQALVMWLQQWFSNQTAYRLAAPIGEYVFCTLAAQLTTLPVLVFHFQRLSLTLLLANLLILPPQPLIMSLGGISTILGLAAPWLGRVSFSLVYPVLLYCTRVIEWLAQIPHDTLAVGTVSVWGVALFYTLLIVLTVRVSVVSGLRRYLTGWVWLTLLFLLSVLVWRVAFAAPNGNLRLTLINFPDGVVYLVQPPSGNVVLIGSSSERRQLEQELERRLSPLRPRISLIILLGQERGRLKTMAAIVERFSPEYMLWQTLSAGNTTAYNLIAALRERDTFLSQMESGQCVDLGSDAQMCVLYADADHAALRLAWRNFRFLIPGGVAEDVMIMERAFSTSNVVVLGENDHWAAVHEWQSITPSTLLWAGKDSAPFASWVSLRDYRWLTLVTDGYRLWVEGR
ncbi:MAG: DUF4131 domain-containing protein [Anaerolineae bacterium]|nr:DUF4131 domain-containing protein [Anaerolineae bacterium]